MAFSIINVVTDLIMRMAALAYFPYGLFVLASWVTQGAGAYFAWTAFKIMRDLEPSEGAEMSGGFALQGRFSGCCEECGGTLEPTRRWASDEARAMNVTISGDLGLFSFVDVDPSLSVHALRAKLAADAAAVAAQLLLSCGGRPLVGSEILRDLSPNDSSCGSSRVLHLELTSYAELIPGAAPLRIWETECRGIRLQQLEELIDFLLKRCVARDATGESIALQDLNLYHLADWVICPATSFDRVSYVELVSTCLEAQRPRWFVSHAWQETVEHFVLCLSKHAEVRELKTSAAYWVCAYANNQHELGNDLRFNPKETSFFRLLLILDPDATPFSRTWCCFELSMAMTETQLLLDIASVAKATSQAELLTDGLTARELHNENCEKARREENFPIELVQKALGIDIVEAKASRAVDKLRILNCIAGLPEEQLDAELPVPLPPERRFCDLLHKSQIIIFTARSLNLRRMVCYAQVNRALRAIFALASVSQVVSKDLLELMPAICRALQEDTARKSLHLSFANSLKFKDMTDLISLAKALPRGLTDLLRLDLRSCHGLFDASVLELGKAIAEMTQLKALFLDFYMCVCLTDVSLGPLFAGVQQHSLMRELDPRNLRGLIKVTERSVTPLLSAWSSMPHLRKLHLNLTQTRRSFEALPLAESIICFSGTQLSDTGMTSLCSGLTTLLSMTRLTLRFRHCGRRLSPASLWDLGESLASLVRLEKLVVDFGKCQGIPRHVAKRYAGNRTPENAERRHRGWLSSRVGMNRDRQGRCL
eukprot:g6869.t1